MQRILLFVFILFLSSVSDAKFLPPAQGKQGMVVTEQRLASEVGQRILQQGGNAIDAAVAVGYALAVVYPCCGNLGGGGFMLIHLATGKNVAINFREKAPSHISSQLFVNSVGKIDQNKARRGYLPVGVPGTVLGLNTALEKYGTMSLAKVMQPAIHLARDGFVLNRFDVKILHLYSKTFQKEANVAKIFLQHNQPLQPGARLVQKQLANTLILISKKGAAAFYNGPIAKAIVHAAKRHGGVLTLADFKNYAIKIVKPITCQYQGYILKTVPPPGSGVTICEILNVVQGYPLAKLGFHSAMSAHYNIEAMRYAFYDRNQLLGDPDFIKNPVQKLLSLKYANFIRKQIKTSQAGDSAKMGKVNIYEQAPNTTHYSIIDKWGNIVSTTVTLNGYFGAKVIAGHTGFFLNNELDDFALVANRANYFGLVQGYNNIIAPNKRPLSSMSPTIILHSGQPFMILGAAGGSTIITSIVQAIENVIDYNMNINAAVNAARYHMQWLPDKVYMEPFTFSYDTQHALRHMGYMLQRGSVYKTLYWGQMAAILKDNLTGMLYGASDNRKPAGAAMAVH